MGKRALVFGWAIATYVLLVFYVTSWWLAIPLSISMGLATAAIGFNVQHDGSHHAYSDRGWVNKVMAFTLDLVGGSSLVWARKHNTLHHMYTNIYGWDDDVEVGKLGSLAPHQKHYPMHRMQHHYLWVLYVIGLRVDPPTHQQHVLRQSMALVYLVLMCVPGTSHLHL